MIQAKFKASHVEDCDLLVLSVTPFDLKGSPLK